MHETQPPPIAQGIPAAYHAEVLRRYNAIAEADIRIACCHSRLQIAIRDGLDEPAIKEKLLLEHLGREQAFAKAAALELIRTFFPEVGQDGNTYNLDTITMTVTIRPAPECQCVVCVMARAQRP